MDTSLLPKAPIERIIRSAGVERVSADAIEATIAWAIPQITAMISQASTYSKHAGRKTLKSIDIEAVTLNSNS